MSKKKARKPVYKTKNSYSVFFLSIILFCFSLLSMIVLQNLSIFVMLILASLISYVPAFLSYKFRRFIITENKIYIYDKDKKILGWSFSEEFECVDFKQSRLGKFFGYGDLYVSNRKNQFYIYKNIQDPQQAYLETIKQYEKIATLLDPSYVPRYNSVNNTIALENGSIQENVDRVI